MRNIRVADRKDWVTQQPAPPAPRRSQPRRFRDIVATIPILLLVPLLVLPFTAVLAGTPTLSASPSSPTPGGYVQVRGTTFPARAWGVVTLDGRYLGVFRSDSAGNVRLTVQISRRVTAGQHRLAARLARGTSDVASTRINVVAPNANLDASETQPPTPKPTQKPEPKADPTPRPERVAEPTATPKPEATPDPTRKPDPTPDPTKKPDPTPDATKKPDPTPDPTKQPDKPQDSGDTVRVQSIPALLKALADNSVTEIVVENGTYNVSPAGAQANNSMWIGSKFADRTKPVVVRAETPGGVTFDGGGRTGFVALWFSQGAHHQTWDGFVFANGTPTLTGVIFFGEHGAAAHHITLRRITIARSITTPSQKAHDHAVYFSSGGGHDILIENMTVDGRGGLDTAFHFYHSNNVSDVTIRDVEVIGTDQAIMLWESSVKNVDFVDIRIKDATRYGVSYEAGSGITFRRVVSTGSGQAGFYSSKGKSPAGVNFVDSSFN